MLKALCMSVSLLLAIPAFAAQGASDSNSLADYAAITYEWTDASGRSHVSNLTERAESYEQIVALLKEVYVNPSVPGFVKDPVGWGTDQGNTHVNVEYAPCTEAPYNMPADMKVETPVEGATALLVELDDSYSFNANHTPEQYIRLFKAVTVLTKQMHIGEESGSTNPGWLFNYVGTLDKFFIITKGCNRVPSNNPKGFAPFYNMYEEFSPSNSGPIDQAYATMNSGHRFRVDLNCSSIMKQNHIVVMSTLAEPEEYPVNFLFYLPDYRFAGDSRTDDGGVTKHEWYTYYSPDHMPFVFFSRIDAAIDGVPSPDYQTGKATVSLDWKSTYKEVSRSQVLEEFYVYRVVNDVMESTPLSPSEFSIAPEHEADMYVDAETGAIISSGETCGLYVYEDMRSISYNVQYIVLGRRHGSDFDMTESNIVRTLIPSLSPAGELEIRIDGEGLSRYDYDNEQNRYENKIMLLDHSGAGERVLQRRHVKVQPDGNNTHFSLRRIVNDGDAAASAEVARMTVTGEKVVEDAAGSWYVYTASITYPEGTDGTGLPLTAEFRSAINTGNPEDDDLIQVSALEENGDVLAMFTDRFSVSTKDGDQPEAYRYYVEYNGVNDITREISKTLSNMVEVTVPVRALRLGYIPYTAAEIASDTDRSNLLPENRQTVWIETRTNPKVTEYIVSDSYSATDVVSVKRMPTGHLVIYRALDKNGTKEKYAELENGFGVKPVVELAFPVDEFSNLSLTLKYSNGNTYGNRHAEVAPLPSVEFHWNALEEDKGASSSGHTFQSYVAWLPMNLGEDENRFEVYGYRLWGRHDGESEEKLLYGMDGDTPEEDDVEHVADGDVHIVRRGFTSHAASPLDPVSVNHTARLYAVIPEELRISQAKERSDAMYAVVNGYHSLTITSPEGVPTGIEGIEDAAPDGEVRYYDLTGREISEENLGRGVYVRVSGGKADKIIR